MVHAFITIAETNATMLIKARAEQLTLGLPGETFFDWAFGLTVY